MSTSIRLAMSNTYIENDFFAWLLCTEHEDAGGSRVSAGLGQTSKRRGRLPSKRARQRVRVGKRESERKKILDICLSPYGSPPVLTLPRSTAMRWAIMSRVFLFSLCSSV